MTEKFFLKNKQRNKVLLLHVYNIMMNVVLILGVINSEFNGVVKIFLVCLLFIKKISIMVDGMFKIMDLEYKNKLVYYFIAIMSLSFIFDRTIPYKFTSRILMSSVPKSTYQLYSFLASKDKIEINDKKKVSHALIGEHSKSYTSWFWFKFLGQILIITTGFSLITLGTILVSMHSYLLFIGLIFMRCALLFTTSTAVDYVSLKNSIKNNDLLSIYLLYELYKKDASVHYIHFFSNFTSYINSISKELGSHSIYISVIY